MVAEKAQDERCKYRAETGDVRSVECRHTPMCRRPVLRAVYNYVEWRECFNLPIPEPN